VLKDRIKTLRNAKGWSQKELARRSGVSQQLIGKIETGGLAESRKIHAIARAFGLSVEELLDAADPVALQKEREQQLVLEMRLGTHVHGYPLLQALVNSMGERISRLDEEQIQDIVEVVEDRVARLLARRDPRRPKRSRKKKSE
jgi:transcriptional regulator with XRE-family HTH domain